MSIRVRSVGGVMIALCAVESDPCSDDLYLDDAVHQALAAKFLEDWQGRKIDWRDEKRAALMASQKVRDAKEELLKWLEGKP